MSVAGVVKFYSEDKGYGFIKRDDGEPDVFIHVSALRRSGLEEVKADDRITFEVEPGKGDKGPRATTIKLS